MASKSEMDKLIASQQTELDAVLLYQALAELAKSEEEKQTFLAMAADEGRHAAILRGITGAQLTPKNTLAKLSATMFRFGGRKVLLHFMAQFEINSFFSYQKYFDRYPEIASIASDEIRHGHLLTAMMA